MRTKGITLIEIIIAVSIFSLMVVAAGKFAGNVTLLNSVNQSKFNAEQDSKKLLRPMIAEIRSASQSSIGAYAIELAATSTFAFFSDIDNDGLKERIRYYLEGKKLKRGQIKPTGLPLAYNQASETVTVLMNDIISTSTPIFYYYDTNYTGTTSPMATPAIISAIRLVKINIAIDSNPVKPPGPFIIQSQVSIRNLKDNL